MQSLACLLMHPLKISLVLGFLCEEGRNVLRNTRFERTRQCVKKYHSLCRQSYLSTSFVQVINGYVVVKMTEKISPRFF